jgi:ATP-dependent Clp endopeptidase proteolytic subunit ClpP
VTACGIPRRWRFLGSISDACVETLVAHPWHMKTTHSSRPSKKQATRAEQPRVSPTIPLPPAPTEVESVPGWMDLFRSHVEARRLALELERLESESERIELEVAKARVERAGLQYVTEKQELDAERARIEMERLRKEERVTAAQAENALIYAFYKDVFEDSVAEAVRTLDEWSRRYPSQPIEVQLTSPGGSVLDGLALFDFLRSLSARGHHITVSTFGFAASMGAVLLQAGDKRRLGANSYVMLHEVSSVAYGKTAEIEESLEFTRKLQDRLIKILCSRSTLTPAEVREMWRKKDIWIDAREAKRLGLVDEIIG